MTSIWVLEIEESKQLIAKGILVAINRKGKKLYMKPVSHKNGFIELTPLTLKELAELKIEVQESCINSDFDVEIEESEGERLPTGEELARRFEEEKKKKQFNLTNLEDMKKAEEIARKAREVLEGKSSDEKIANEVRKTITDRYIALGHTPPNLETKEDIESATEILKSLQDKEKQIHRLQDQIPAPSGSAPLSGQYSNVIGWCSTEAMIKDLRKRAKSGDSEADIILSKLWHKTVRAMKERNSTELPFPTEPEPIGDNATAKEIEVPINAPPNPNEQSELEKWGIKTGKKRRDD
jgi:hypothetical protein